MLASTPKSSSSHFQKSTPFYPMFFFPHPTVVFWQHFLPSKLRDLITKLPVQEVPGLFWLVMSGSTAFSCLVLVTRWPRSYGLPSLLVVDDFWIFFCKSHCEYVYISKMGWFGWLVGWFIGETDPSHGWESQITSERCSWYYGHL